LETSIRMEGKREGKKLMEVEKHEDKGRKRR
jgi:hypothetical protein